MVRLALDDEESALLTLAKQVGIEVLSPAARSAEAEHRVPDRVSAILTDTGLIGDESAPSERRNAVSEVAAAEGLCYGDAGITLSAIWLDNAFATLVADVGTPTQCTELLGARRAGAVALYEGYGRTPLDLATTVELSDDTVRIRGQKNVVAINDESGSLLVVARESETGSLRIVVVPVGTPGVTINPIRGSLALGAASLRTVDLNVTLRRDVLLGGTDADPDRLARSVERFRLLVAAALIGVGQRAIDHAAEYATQRVAFGRPIAGFQGVSFPLAEAHTMLEQARTECYLAASSIDSAVMNTVDLDIAVTDAISYAASAATSATRTAVQTFGGHGFLRDHPVELWYRAAAFLSTVDLDPTAARFVPAV